MTTLARGLILMTALMATGASAQDLPETTLSVVGSWSNLPLNQEYEAPFWTETLPAASNGAISVSLTTFDQMGVQGADVFRLLADGVFDVGMTVADYTVGDAPELEGLDVPLIASDAETARAVAEAAKPMLEDIMRDRFNSKLLAVAPYPPQVVFCNAEIGGLQDLQGQKVRASGRMTAIFLEELGAEGVTMAFSEVPGALERGVIDCAVTGAGSGYSAGWWESSTHLLNLPLGGWDPVVTAMNLDKWESLAPEVQSFLQEQIRTGFENPAWEQAADALSRDIACLTGDGDCAAGEPASMTLVEPTEADRQLAVQVLTESVLPDWSERAGAEWAQRWNEAIGSVVGVAVPVN